MQPAHETSAGSAAGDDMTFEDVQRAAGEWWVITPITGGYKAVIREAEGTPLPRYYSRGFPVCVRAAALRDAMLMAAGYMLSPPSGRRLSGGCLEEPGAVVVPAGGGLVASPPQRPAQGGREPGAGEQPGGGLPGQCGEPGGLGDR